jgi:hypothetical protein
MALGLTQSLTEMNTKNLHGGKGRSTHMTDNLTAICEPTVYRVWEPRRLTTLWASSACYRDSFTFMCGTCSVHLYLSVPFEAHVWNMYVHCVAPLLS